MRMRTEGGIPGCQVRFPFVCLLWAFCCMLHAICFMLYAHAVCFFYGSLTECAQGSNPSSCTPAAHMEIFPPHHGVAPVGALVPQVILTRIYAPDGAFFIGVELCTKLLGGDDHYGGTPLLDLVRWPDGSSGWRDMAEHEWAALCAATGIEDGYPPILINARCLGPLMEEMGVQAGLISALMDVPALPQGTQVCTHV
jgi:hypothetical protein